MTDNSYPIDFEKIEVPPYWTGYTREGVWACGACPDTGPCIESGVCQRAVDLGVLDDRS